MERIKILSIDGGGIRGIIPAFILAEIERRTKKPIAELFHLIAGTSTGGILALALTKPSSEGKPAYTAEELISLYEVEGPVIFHRPLLHKIRALGNLVEEKYPSSGIEKILDKYFKDSRLKDALTDVIITAYEIERRISFFFKSRRAKEDSNYDFLMKEVARATSAAPTFFEPSRIDLYSDYYALVDGGVFANNPAMCAYAEALKNYPNINREDFLVVSLGTGEATRCIPYEEAKRWGLAGWLVPLLGIVFDGINDTVDYQLRQILPKESYYRFQVVLYQGNEDMDDASSQNIRILKLLAEELINKEKDKLDRLCEELMK
jgi:patatin-like phospholipase/acyl hydrolase